MEDHGALEPGKLPRALTRGLRETRVDKEQAVQKSCSWIMQNEMRGVLGRVSAGAACRILDSARSSKIRA